MAELERMKAWEQHALNNWDKLLPSTEQLENVGKVAELALKTGYLAKDIQSREKVEYIIMMGLEVGMTPIQALRHISVIQGKPCVGAEGMLHLIYKNCPSATIQFVNGADPNQICTIMCKRSESEQLQKFQYSLNDAEKAGLLNKDNWRKYPRAMLRARCISEMARAKFADAIGGISYTPEELGALVNEDGEILHTPAPAADQVSRLGKPQITSDVDGDRKEDNKRAEQTKRITKQTKRAAILDEVNAILEEQPPEEFE